MSHYEIYLKFLKETTESELVIGDFAYQLSKLFNDIPSRMKMTQAFNIIYKFAYRTPGWKLAHNSKYQQVLRRNGDDRSNFEGTDHS